MGDQKNLGNDFESALEKLCHSQGITVSRIHDGFKRTGAGSLIAQKQPCDFVWSTPGPKSAMIDAKTQGSGKTFNKSHVDEDQLKAMWPHRENGVPCGYVVWFRDQQQLVFFDVYQLKQDKRHINDGLLLGHLVSCDLKKIFTCEKPTHQLQSLQP